MSESCWCEWVLFYVFTLDVSELADGLGCLSDSTSEEHSLSSYTSESFDDNGKTLMLKWTKAHFNCQKFVGNVPQTSTIFGPLIQLKPGTFCSKKQKSPKSGQIFPDILTETCNCFSVYQCLPSSVCPLPHVLHAYPSNLVVLLLLLSLPGLFVRAVLALLLVAWCCCPLDRLPIMCCLLPRVITSCDCIQAGSVLNGFWMCAAVF